MFCHNPFSKLPRDLESMHREEAEVAMLQSTKRSEERQKLLCKLRNVGNHIHNCEVLRKGEGTIIAAYRPKQSNAVVNDYGPCPFWYGYYVRTELWKHKCPLQIVKEDPDEDVVDKSGASSSKRLKLHGRRAHESTLEATPFRHINTVEWNHRENK